MLLRPELRLSSRSTCSSGQPKNGTEYISEEFPLFFIAGDGGITKKETKHAQKKIFAHPVSVVTGEVDLSQSVCINELTQERCVCGLLRGRNPLFHTALKKA